MCSRDCGINGTIASFEGYLVYFEDGTSLESMITVNESYVDEETYNSPLMKALREEDDT